jgi:hypothetical protein
VLAYAADQSVSVRSQAVDGRLKVVDLEDDGCAGPVRSPSRRAIRARDRA